VHWFATRWHLPRDHGPRDLDSSILLALNGFEPPGLGVWGGRGGWIPTIGHPADELRAAGVDPPPGGGDRSPLIVLPPLPRAIRYDPTIASHDNLPATIRKGARALARKVEASIVEQARAFEAQAKAGGYCALPPHFRTPEQRQQAALRLYRYVIDGQDWDTIADAEAGRRGKDYAPSADTMRRTATDLAERLTIPMEPRGLQPAPRNLAP
jgi:hypothetical protein